MAATPFEVKTAHESAILDKSVVFVDRCGIKCDEFVLLTGSGVSHLVLFPVERLACNGMIAFPARHRPNRLMGRR